MDMKSIFGEPVSMGDIAKYIEVNEDGEYEIINTNADVDTDVERGYSHRGYSSRGAWRHYTHHTSSKNKSQNQTPKAPYTPHPVVHYVVGKVTKDQNGAYYIGKYKLLNPDKFTDVLKWYKDIEVVAIGTPEKGTIEAKEIYIDHPTCAKVSKNFRWNIHELAKCKKQLKTAADCKKKLDYFKKRAELLEKQLKSAHIPHILGFKFHAIPGAAKAEIENPIYRSNLIAKHYVDSMYKLAADYKKRLDYRHRHVGKVEPWAGIIVAGGAQAYAAFSAMTAGTGALVALPGAGAFLAHRALSKHMINQLRDNYDRQVYKPIKDLYYKYMATWKAYAGSKYLYDYTLGTLNTMVDYIRSFDKTIGKIRSGLAKGHWYDYPTIGLGALFRKGFAGDIAKFMQKIRDSYSAVTINKAYNIRNDFRAKKNLLIPSNTKVPQIVR